MALGFLTENAPQVPIIAEQAFRIPNTMATSNELNSLTLANLERIAKEIGIPGWSKMRKEDLVRVLVAKSRSKVAGEAINNFLNPAKKKSAKPAESGKKSTVSKASDHNKGKNSPKTDSASRPKTTSVSPQTPAKEPEPQRLTGVDAVLPHYIGKQALRRDLSTRMESGKPDRLVLMVRDPFWLHVFWEVSTKTMERAKVALGHQWYGSFPALRLFQLLADGTGAPKRQLVRNVPVHGGVNNWYLDVTNPPATFIVELGYMTKEKKFHPTLSSNIVETPQQQVIDELDKLDGNWKGVADDLGRVFKLSSSEGHSQELKEVMEEQLGRPMSSQLLSRDRVAKQGNIGKTQRNFRFGVDVDVIIHGKTDTNVQVSIRNEPVKVQPDGTFQLRVALPEKRHMFPIEAEGSDGVEMQRVILTLERNTRILETVIQEPSDDD
ncbi:MAG: DUF4912 domain-containing protein [Planctomycetaceae bacterium]|jgi:hypothetical protein|nr:DUF4912 domain-containing protein [Planctomycetaceae bacterium]